MAQVSSSLSTGLPGLDKVLRGLIPGDNIVWQVGSVEDYKPLLRPYCETAERLGQRLVYFRFARHEPLLSADDGADVFELHPENGFEAFIAEIHARIEETGRGGYYVFDCLSDLAVDWYSDQMLGNFFMLTCPYLYDVGAIAYFALLRNYHSYHAAGPIGETTQILIEVFRHKDTLYLHPTKVQARYSPTMHMLHRWVGDGEFEPVTQSAVTSEILTSEPWLQLQAASYRLGVWNRAFVEAEEVMRSCASGECSAEQVREVCRRLIRMAISRDDRMAGLVERYLKPSEIVDIGKRMIGTGLIGGKSVGMLLARAILRDADPLWEERLEPHDSFYIGSDVFYTFLVRNGIWWVRDKQRHAETFLEGAEQARQRMLMGAFPDYIMGEFERMLDYFGQSPIIVRSSSLLEDNFGNSFAGKYESVFCANQGPREKRLDDFVSAVRTIYASSMSEKALLYRHERGLLDRDEQMALLVQRVSGALHDHLFYPQIAGVGFSYNPYVWSETIDPRAGMLRLVFGLGTRAVDRSDDDYTRVVALNAPDRRPETNFDEVRRYAQRKVDVLELEANQLVATSFRDVVAMSPDLALDLFVSRDERAARRAEERGMGDPSLSYVLTFDRLFTETDYVGDMRNLLQALQEAYDYPVDVEFTTNFLKDGSYKINLVQCRPLQVREGLPIMDPPSDLAEEDVLLEAHGAVIGQSRLSDVDRIIYVVPSVYGRMPMGDRYAVARLIGKLVHLAEDAPPETILLVGPGRWGTTTPSLGVPVRFADINRVSVVVEVVAMRDDLVPDVSLGTHFLSELVEMDMLYCALFPKREENRLNADRLEAAPNRLTELLPEEADWAHAVRVIDPGDIGGGTVTLNANNLKQHVVCYLGGQGGNKEARNPKDE